MVLDYSKWDAIVDSDEEDAPKRGFTGVREVTRDGQKVYVGSEPPKAPDVDNHPMMQDTAVRAHMIAEYLSEHPLDGVPPPLSVPDSDYEHGRLIPDSVMNLLMQSGLSGDRGLQAVSQWLGEDGAHVDARSSSVCGRSTLLMAASAAGHVGLVRFLIERGASLDLYDPFGGTAYNMAKLFDHREVEEALVAAGASTARSEAHKKQYPDGGLFLAERGPCADGRCPRDWLPNGGIVK